mgnify:CR=1 FL=1
MMDKKKLAKEFSELLDKDTDLTMFTIQDLTLVKTGQQVVMAIVLKRKVVTEVTTTFDALSFYSENSKQDFSSLRMKVTDGVTTSETRIPSSADGNLPFWVIGCMTADDLGFNYIPGNTLTEQSALVSYF